MHHASFKLIVIDRHAKLLLFLGHLRFRKPVAKEPWTNVYDATKKCPHPFQFNGSTIGSKHIGSEDCLYLNVFTPDIPVTENQTKLPVMVWFFGVNFVKGTCSDEFFGPNRLMQSSEVVVVTVNYRLGPFGFLSMGVPSCPGNQGLWDQLLALKWVKENIAAFGGDENNVTLLGHGSGSVCASYHLISPTSSGMFARVVLMSGTLAAPIHNLHHDPMEVGLSFAKEFGIIEQDTESIIEQLQLVPADEILEKALFMMDWSDSSPNPWMPCLDHDFIPEHPIELLNKGVLNKMPILIGHTQHEGAWYLNQDLDTEKYLLTHFEALASILLFNTSLDEDILLNGVLKKIQDFYADHDDMTSMIGEANVICSNHYFLTLIKKISAQPAFMYSFDYKGDWKTQQSMPDLWQSTMRTVVLRRMSLIGLETDKALTLVNHGDEIPYLFQPNSRFWNDSLFLKSDRDKAVSTKFVRMLINFCKQSSPTPNPKGNCLIITYLKEPFLLTTIFPSTSVDSSLRDLLWDPYQYENNGPFLRIDHELKVEQCTKDQLKKIRFWSTIFSEFLAQESDMPLRFFAKPFKKRYNLEK